MANDGHPTTKFWVLKMSVAGAVQMLLRKYIVNPQYKQNSNIHRGTASPKLHNKACSFLPQAHRQRLLVRSL